MDQQFDYFPPVPAPLELRGECLERYLEIRMLRLLFDSTGARSVCWDDETGEARPGARYPNAGIYGYPATGPSDESSGT